ncbi:hypothetical protein [Streptomyces regalis]|nr:hypothetical protein [Streptomyces regalis]
MERVCLYADDRARNIPTPPRDLPALLEHWHARAAAARTAAAARA